MLQSKLRLVIIIIVLLAVAGGIYLSLEERALEESREQESLPAVRSIAGKVVSVNVQENSFSVSEQKGGGTFRVRLSEDAEFIRLSFPSSAEGETFVIPEREDITVADVRVGDDVFVRSSDFITSDQDIIHPIEVQILP